MGSQRVRHDWATELNWTERYINIHICIYMYSWPSLVAQLIESACNAGDPGWSLGWKDPLEKEMATHSSILAWKIPWIEEPGRFSPWSHRVAHDWASEHIIQMQRTKVWSLAQNIPHTTGQLSLCATITEPTCWFECMYLNHFAVFLKLT